MPNQWELIWSFYNTGRKGGGEGKKGEGRKGGRNQERRGGMGRGKRRGSKKMEIGGVDFKLSETINWYWLY